MGFSPILDPTEDVLCQSELLYESEDEWESWEEIPVDLYQENEWLDLNSIWDEELWEEIDPHFNDILSRDVDQYQTA